MRHLSIPRRKRFTERLVLRPSSSEDASRAFEIRSDWNVARMLRLASFPPDMDETQSWFDGHEQEWLQGRAYRFAVVLSEQMIGLVDLDGVDRDEGHLGYWLERSAWGNGYAFGAARAVVQFAFREIGLKTLRAEHAVDNPASGKVLNKLGFMQLDTVERFSKSRGENIMQRRYMLSSYPG